MEIEAEEECLVVEPESAAAVAVEVGLHQPSKGGMPACKPAGQ